MMSNESQSNFPKNQHYMNVSYLRRFSIDPTIDNRKKLMIFRLDKGHQTSKLVPTESQCFDPFYYSKIEASARSMEDALRMMENNFGKIVDKLVKDKDLSSKEEASLFRILIIQHLRTRSYKSHIEHVKLEDNTYREYENYERLLDDAFRLFTLINSFGINNEKYVSFKEVIDAGHRIDAPIDKNWKYINLRIDEKISNRYRFVTSCHPVLLFSNNSAKIPVTLIIMPYTPIKAIIAYHDTYHKLIKNKVGTQSDIGYINQNIIIRAEKEILSNFEINYANNSTLFELIGSQSKLGYSTQEGLNLEVTNYIDELSILKNINK